MSTICAVPTIQQQGESIVNDAPRTFGSDVWDGKVTAHQGDVIILRLTKLPDSAKPRTNRQMAIGNTQGSRHMLEGGEAFDCDATEMVKIIKRVYGATVRPGCIGPVFRGPATLSHPEHGNHVYECDCVNAVVYQRSLDAEERESRVQD